MMPMSCSASPSLSVRVLLLCALLVSLPVGAAPPISGSGHGPAIDGYDPVAYFTQGKAQRGSPDITFAWQNAEWRFISEENRDRFAADPERYAPQYGGYCAYAMSGGGVVRGDGERWKIVDDKLYLNANWFADKLWQNDIPANIQDADRHWPQAQRELKPDKP